MACSSWSARVPVTSRRALRGGTEGILHQHTVGGQSVEVRSVEVAIDGPQGLPVLLVGTKVEDVELPPGLIRGDQPGNRHGSHCSAS